MKLIEKIQRFSIGRQMRRDWDSRARENALYYVATGNQDWDKESFFTSGEKHVREVITNDMENICQGKDPASMKVLEIGCGVGRVTRALAAVFGEIHGVDVSGEMIARARQFLQDYPNVHLHQNNGTNLSRFPDQFFDFAYSGLVFQHISDRKVIENYVAEVGRVLKPGCLFKFQLQGGRLEVTPPSWLDQLCWWRQQPEQTWLGASFSEDQAIAMARDAGFDPRYLHGAGTQEYWLWFFKN